jgi:FAD/FMN-containing dehydrogenase
MPALQSATRNGGRTVLDDAVIQGLRADLRGALILPGDAAYDEARRVWNGMVDRRPALIVRCAGAADVLNAVRFGREHDLLTSVRGGGHNIAGKSVCDGGFMIDLSRMRSVQVDPIGRTARVEGGATLRDLDHETQAFGLATTAGVVTHTGVAGLTLGGGIGRMGRKHGLACDNLLSAHLVTADGQFLRASEKENGDLFWGIRGGGGNFGIVTSFEFRLHPVGPVVLGGKVVHPLARAREALTFYAEFSRKAPDELSGDAILLTTTEGERVVAISACYIGPLEEGERVLRPLRQVGQPLIDDIGPVPYARLQAEGDAFFPTGFHHYWKTHFLTDISEGAIDVVLRHFAEVPSPRSIVVFQQYGGAVGRVPPGATAFRHREAQYDFLPTAIWSDPAESEANVAWVRGLWEAMKPFATGGEYMNNLGEEGEDRVRAAYGANYERLVALKNKYDPTNFFRLNANVRPTVPDAGERARPGRGPLAP